MYNEFLIDQNKEELNKQKTDEAGTGVTST
jgi:hypothetical protein